MRSVRKQTHNKQQSWRKMLQPGLFLSELVFFFHCYCCFYLCMCHMCVHKHMLSYVSRIQVSECMRTCEFTPGLLMWLLSHEKCSCVHVRLLLCEISPYHSGECREKKKKKDRLSGGGVCCLLPLGVDVRCWWGIKMEKLEIMKLFCKFNEYICSVEPRHKAQFTTL